MYEVPELVFVIIPSTTLKHKHFCSCFIDEETQTTEGKQWGHTALS